MRSTDWESRTGQQAEFGQQRTFGIYPKRASIVSLLSSRSIVRRNLSVARILDDTLSVVSFSCLRRFCLSTQTEILVAVAGDQIATRIAERGEAVVRALVAAVAGHAISRQHVRTATVGVALLWVAGFGLQAIAGGLASVGRHHAVTCQ